MSGATNVCTVCGGEFRSFSYEAGKYMFGGGWCDTCQRPVVQVPSKAYEDDDFDVSGYSTKIASVIRNMHYQSFKVIDTPEFQFKWTTEPNDEHECSSCIHGYRKVQDGEDAGQACRMHPEYKPRFNAHLTDDCKEYEPRDTWNNMGGHCRYCYWATGVRIGAFSTAYCNKKGQYLEEVSEYDKGHCKDAMAWEKYWWFQKKGITKCPECDRYAIIIKGHRIACRCGFKGDLE